MGTCQEIECNYNCIIYSLISPLNSCLIQWFIVLHLKDIIKSYWITTCMCSYFPLAVTVYFTLQDIYHYWTEYRLICYYFSLIDRGPKCCNRSCVRNITRNLKIYKSYRNLIFGQFIHCVERSRPTINTVYTVQSHFPTQ